MKRAWASSFTFIILLAGAASCKKDEQTAADAALSQVEAPAVDEAEAAPTATPAPAVEPPAPAVPFDALPQAVLGVVTLGNPSAFLDALTRLANTVSPGSGLALGMARTKLIGAKLDEPIYGVFLHGSSVDAGAVVHVGDEAPLRKAFEGMLSVADARAAFGTSEATRKQVLEMAPALNWSGPSDTLVAEFSSPRLRPLLSDGVRMIAASPQAGGPNLAHMFESFYGGALDATERVRLEATLGQDAAALRMQASVRPKSILAPFSAAITGAYDSKMIARYGGSDAMVRGGGRYDTSAISDDTMLAMLQWLNGFMSKKAKPAALKRQAQQLTAIMHACEGPYYAEMDMTEVDGAATMFLVFPTKPAFASAWAAYHDVYSAWFEHTLDVGVAQTIGQGCEHDAYHEGDAQLTRCTMETKLKKNKHAEAGAAMWQGKQSIWIGPVGNMFMVASVRDDATLQDPKDLVDRVRNGSDTQAELVAASVQAEQPAMVLHYNLSKLFAMIARKQGREMPAAMAPVNLLVYGGGRDGTLQVTMRIDAASLAAIRTLVEAMDSEAPV